MNKLIIQFEAKSRTFLTNQSGVGGTSPWNNVGKSFFPSLFHLIYDKPSTTMCEDDGEQSGYGLYLKGQRRMKYGG